MGRNYTNKKGSDAEHRSQFLKGGQNCSPCEIYYRELLLFVVVVFFTTIVFLSD